MGGRKRLVGWMFGKFTGKNSTLHHVLCPRRIALLLELIGQHQQAVQMVWVLELENLRLKKSEKNKI